MATLGEAINQLAISAGLTADNEHLKTFLSSPTISGANFPDEILNALNTGLLTVESAKANPTIVNHFKAQIYNGVDNELTNTLKKLNVYDDFKADLDGEKSSTKKIALAMEKVAEKFKAASGEGDKKELAEKLNALQKQYNESLSGKGAEIEAAVSKVKEDYEGQFTELAYGKVFSGMKLANPLDWDAELLHNAAKTTVNGAAASKGYDIKRNGASFDLLTKEGTKVFENNKEVTYNDFAQKVLLEKKMLEVAGPSKPAAPTQTVHGTPAPAAPRNNSYAAAAAQSSAEHPLIPN